MKDEWYVCPKCQGMSIGVPCQRCAMIEQPIKDEIARLRALLKEAIDYVEATEFMQEPVAIDLAKRIREELK